jgi:hypothetical protein
LTAELHWSHSNQLACNYADPARRHDDIGGEIGAMVLGDESARWKMIDASLEHNSTAPAVGRTKTTLIENVEGENQGSVGEATGRG